MAKFRTITSDFWTDEYISSLSPQECYLYLFLIANPFNDKNNLGIVNALPKHIAPLVNLSTEIVDNILKKLENDGKIVRSGSKILLVNFIKNQTNNSPKIIAGLKSEFCAENSPAIKKALRQTYPAFFEDIEEEQTAENEAETDTLPIPYPYPIHTLPIQKEEEREEEEENELEKEKEEKNIVLSSAKASDNTCQQVDTQPPAPVSSKSSKSCPQKQIIELYHELLPMLPRVRSWEGSRPVNLKARWNSKIMTRDGKGLIQIQELEWWRKFFAYIRDRCPFLLGQVEPTGNRKPFVANLAWIIKAENFTKIIEGKYEE